MLGLQGYDILMLSVLIAATVFGLWKGMVWQVASLGSVFLSVVVAVRFSPALAPHLSHQVPWNRFLAMFILYVLTSAMVWLAFRSVARLIDRVRLKDFDHQVGAIFGLAKGVVYCVVITFFAVTISEDTRQAVLRSRSGYYIAVLTRNAEPVLPKEVRDVVGKYIDELRQKLDPQTAPARTLPAPPTPRSPGAPAPGVQPHGQGEFHDRVTSDAAGEPPGGRWPFPGHYWVADRT
jgi:membrane protein required for colicin V production